MIKEKDSMGDAIKELMEIREKIKEARTMVSEMESLHNDKVEDLKEA